MNKRFSTLLASVLLAGSMSANAQDVAYPIDEYIQLKVGTQFLVVGEGATRDSLALVANPTTLEGLNKTLWKLNVTPVMAENGLIKQYAVSLENKVNGSVKLTKEDADASKSLYYAPGAVVAAGEQAIISVDADQFNAETQKVTFDWANVNFAPSKYYDAAAKKVIAFQLEKTAGDVIKLMAASEDAAEVETEDELNSITPTFTGTKLAINQADLAADPTPLTADMLNSIGNEAFQLFFSNDITDNAKFSNPFSASELKAVEGDVYSSASYNLTDYEDALEDVEGADGVIGLVAEIKANVAAYAKEVKEALSKNGTSAAGLATAAPNAADLTAIATAIDQTAIQTVFVANGDVDKAVKTLTDKVATYTYAEVTGSTPTIYQVAEADKKKAEVDKLVAAVNKAIDDLNVAPAVAKIKAAVADFVKVPYREGSEVLDFTNYKVGDKTADVVLKALAAKYNATQQTTLEALAADDIVDVTASSVISGAGNANGYAFAVVGQKDKYVTVDTVYVAEQEKYLSLNTTTLKEVVVLQADKSAVDVTADGYEFAPATMEKILVPELGKLAKPALFQMNIYLKDVATTDSIEIKGYAPVLTTQQDYYSELTDADMTSTSATKVVIRTLANSREASILADGEEEDAVNNTKISFTEPKLATLIKDGAIYFIIEKTKETEKEGKYRVATPADFTTWAKVAYENVPGTQYVATKNGNIYSLDNRDFAVSQVSSQKLYVVGDDETDMIYTTSARDTFQLVEIADAKDEHLGYKFITEQVQQISDYVLSAINYANPEVPFFLTFDGNADSTLVAAKDQTKALNLKVLLNKDKKEVTSAYEMNDKNLEKQFYQLYAKSGKDTLYLDVNEDNELVVTKVPTNLLLQFRNVNNEVNEYEVLIGAYNATSKTYDADSKISYNQDGQAVAVDLDEATAFVYDLTDNSTDIYKNFGITKPTNVIISLDGDPDSKVTAVKPFAVVKRTGLELKAAATDNDFVLGLDTAYVDRKDNIRYAYYITKPIDIEKVGSFDKKAYMVSYADSTACSNDTVQYTQDNLTRIGFVHAQRVEAFNNDSLAIAKPAAAAADTINVVDNKGVTPATWAFAIESDGTYRIETAADGNGNKYVSYLNGILVLGNREQAQLFNVNETDLAPTDNEEIATSEVTVIAGEGQVTVAGAQGKKVVVTNVLGQVVANKVIASDNATIAAPQGVVVVAVEGEEAVKAIVK